VNKDELNRLRLAEATTRYFRELSPKAISEEQALAKTLSSAASQIDFDREE
jgi:hypothetical protein